MKWPASEKLLFVKVMLISALCRLIVLLVPMKHWVRFINRGCRKNAGNHDVKLLHRAIVRVKKIAFWRVNCLNSCLTVHWALALKGLDSNMVLAVKMAENNKMHAHAWLEINNDKYHYLSGYKNITFA
ncbi:MAG: lasso peptide biosynthesis B2 protein [Bacteroidales bacterium]|nr:lasso peptide biosynthesis B2 protein [Bacteroidales bacterium]